MANILVISHKVPWPLIDGHALRVFRLAEHLEPTHACHLVCMHQNAEHLPELRRQKCFETITLLPPLPERRHRRRFFRYLRRDGDRDYFRLAYPEYFLAALDALQGIVDRQSVDIVVASLVRCEEFMRPLRNVKKLLDQYDCATLALERDLEARDDLGFLRRQRLCHYLHRMRSTEGHLHRRCDLVTAISPPDVARLRALNPDGPPVELVPNGVDADLLELDVDDSSGMRAVAFWGNLCFPVNRLAIERFYRDIWLPLLLPAGVRWAIVGPNADAGLRELSQKHPEIEVPGFVPDLYDYLKPYPVMINPMINGTGLKNKVLEAMAAGKAVVTTSLGVDALPFVDGVHGRIADDPAAFASAVLDLLNAPEQRRAMVFGARDLVRSHYSWAEVGACWSLLLAKLGGVQSR